GGRAHELHPSAVRPAELVDHRRVGSLVRRHQQLAGFAHAHGQEAVLFQVLGREPLRQRPRCRGPQVRPGARRLGRAPRRRGRRARLKRRGRRRGGDRGGGGGGGGGGRLGGGGAGPGGVRVFGAGGAAD